MGILDRYGQWAEERRLKRERQKEFRELVRRGEIIARESREGAEGGEREPVRQAI